MTNPVRVCPACGKEDNHPRCSVQLPDGRWADYHFDCAAILGVEHAKEMTQGLKKGSIGEDMREHLVARAAELSPEEAV